MLELIYSDAEERMGKVITALKKEFSVLRAGRATPALLDRIEVEYYGTATPLNQLAGVTAPEPRLLVVQPWDKQALGDIEKAILKSDLGLTPNNDGNIIRLPIPQLTEERRMELAKFIRKKAEESKVIIRNVRREANDEIKKLEKAGDLAEDDRHRGQDQVQVITDKMIKQVDDVLEAKEKEIMEV